MLLVDADEHVKLFDSRLKELQRERIRVQEKSQLLELHLHQLHREMNVLNRFEMHEDRLAERVYVKLMQVRAVQQQIIDCEHRIEEHMTEKDNLGAMCEDLQRKFKRLVQDNKFADFLRRIFKKKYRQPRIRDDDESSESESESSSSEEDDEGSLDSRDIGPIRLDPNICPEGCDRETYDKTFEMRNTRHKHEQNMMEQDRLVELLKRDIEAHNKIKRKLSVQLDRRKNDLREFMLEKQTCMNEVDTVVVLRYDQIRAASIVGCTGPQGLSQTVVFPEALLSRLRKRVLELLEEIKEQKLRQRINRTHLFRMNIDLRAMEAEAEDLRAQMRDVLTRKLGKPRKVDRTLDDLLRQMARRHKYALSYGTLPHVIAQLRTWSERHSTLEKKYLKTLNNYSDRLRLAAAMQAEVLPLKPTKIPVEMAGGYNAEIYQRDVMRLLIVRQRQKQQIKQLQEEIASLRQKPLSYRAPQSTYTPLEPEQSDIYLFMVPRSHKQQRMKYFPITPLGSRTKLRPEVNITTLLYDCLDAMHVSRDDAELLLLDVMKLLPDVVTGKCSRYELVDTTVRTWLLKSGGDPSQYKKQTRAFDALAALTDRLVRQQIEAMEAPEDPEGVIDDLEDALRDLTEESDTLADRLGPAIAALLHSAHFTTIEDPETLASLVKSLTDDNHPITKDSVERICSFDLLEDIKECGIDMPTEELRVVIDHAMDALRAQIVEPLEASEVQKEVQKALRDKDIEAMIKKSIISVASDRKTLDSETSYIRKRKQDSQDRPSTDRKSILAATSTSEHKSLPTRVSIATQNVRGKSITLSSHETKLSTLSMDERKTLANRISTSILGRSKTSQSDGVKVKPSVQIDLPTEESQKTEGEQKEGEQTEDKQAESEQVDGKEIEGEQTDGEQAQGEQVDSEQADGKQKEGEQTDSKQAEGGPAGGGPAEGGPAEGGPAEGGPAEGGPAEGGPAEAEKAETKETEDKQAEGGQAEIDQAERRRTIFEEGEDDEI
uniref:SFRICE_008424 n=1 Tax=Spodoptera frugiperda TaxID=7108 RepID=A0A2H1VUZ2_SPOFR